MQLIGVSGKRYYLETSPFAQGGEGMVFNDIKNKNIVCKVYKSGLNTKEKEKKLLYMFKKPPAKEVLDQIAWPMDVLYDTQNRFVGFVMLKLSISDDLNVIYEFGDSAKYKNIPWSNKIIIAENLCAVLDAVHKAGHIVGDFNPRNISVDPKTGHVIFVDTDSYHITEGSNVYRCNVGMSEYLPKEIQIKMTSSLAAAPLPTFSPESDNFALAIHIFQLLMNGCHPYSCKVIPGQVSITKPSRDENISKGFCPFFIKNSSFDIPSFAPSIDILSDDLKKLFKRAFIDSTNNPKIRPTAEEWYNALKKMQVNLKTCSRNTTHEFYKTLSVCPWCSSESNYINTINQSAVSLSQQSIKRPLTPSTSSSSVKHYQANQPIIRAPSNNTTTVSQSSTASNHKYEKPSSTLALVIMLIISVMPILVYFFQPWLVLLIMLVAFLVFVILFNRNTKFSGYGNSYPTKNFVVPFISCLIVFALPFINMEFIYPDLTIFKAAVESGMANASVLNTAIPEAIISYSFAYLSGIIGMIILFIKGDKTSRSIYPVIGFSIGMVLYIFLMRVMTINLNELAKYKGGIDFFTFLGSILMVIPVLGTEIITSVIGKTGDY